MISSAMAVASEVIAVTYQIGLKIRPTLAVLQA
jgi:hypothetical protein